MVVAFGTDNPLPLGLTKSGEAYPVSMTLCSRRVRDLYQTAAVSRQGVIPFNQRQYHAHVA